MALRFKKKLCIFKHFAIACFFVACKLPSGAEIRLPELSDVPINVVIPIEYALDEEITEDDTQNIVSIQENCSSPTNDPANPDPAKPASDPTQPKKEEPKKASVDSSPLTGALVPKFFDTTAMYQDQKKHYAVYFFPPLLKPSTFYELTVDRIITEKNKTIEGNKICFQTANSGLKYSKNISRADVYIHREKDDTSDSRDPIFVSFEKPVDPDVFKSGVKICKNERSSSNTEADDICHGNIELRAKPFLVVDLQPNEKGWVIFDRMTYVLRGINLEPFTVENKISYRVALSLKRSESGSEELELGETTFKIKNRSSDPKKPLVPSALEIYCTWKNTCKNETDAKDMKLQFIPVT